MLLLGQLIPAGTGMRRYRGIDIVDESGLPLSNTMEEIIEEAESE